MIEMKKMIKFAGIALISAALLSACSNAKNNTQKKAETAAQSSTIEASDSNENEPNTENITQAVKQLEEKVNSDEKLVKIDVKNNVTDDTSDNPHAVITVKVINDEAKKNMEEMQTAIDSNSGTEAQKTAIYGIQLNVEEVAKTLENDNDVISFITPYTNGNDRTIAKSTKNENIIPLVK